MTGDVSNHVCDSGYFDRTVCAEPCGAMHSYCDTCGKRADPCAHEADSPLPLGDNAPGFGPFTDEAGTAYRPKLTVVPSEKATDTEGAQYRLELLRKVVSYVDTNGADLPLPLLDAIRAEIGGPR